MNFSCLLMSKPHLHLHKLISIVIFSTEPIIVLIVIVLLRSFLRTFVGIVFVFWFQSCLSHRSNPFNSECSYRLQRQLYSNYRDHFCWLDMYVLLPAIFLMKFVDDNTLKFTSTIWMSISQNQTNTDQSRHGK
jgi:hypothetical protein